MFTDYLRQMSSLYDNMDSVIITDKDGVVEYSAAPDENGVVQENFTYVGKKILEIYPELTPETSTIMRVRLNEKVTSTFKRKTTGRGWFHKIRYRNQA